MHTETMQGIGPLQVLAILFHLGILIIIQQLWNRLAKQLRVDRLSLVNDRSTRTAVVRALMTRTAFWIWACGLYTLFAWHLNGFLSPLLGPDWATHSRQVAMIKVL